MDAFEIVVPCMSVHKEQVLLTKVYAYHRHEVDTFIKQHGIKVYDVNIIDASQIGHDFDIGDTLQEYEFGSNHDNNKYRILTTETLIHDAIDYIAEILSNRLMFGYGILQTDIPVIDLINTLIETLRHTQIIDYVLLDSSYCNARGEEFSKHYRTFSNKTIEMEDMPDNNDPIYNYPYDSLHNASLLHGHGTEPITIEGYVEYIAVLLTDRI